MPGEGLLRHVYPTGVNEALTINCGMAAPESGG